MLEGIAENASVLKPRDESNLTEAIEKIESKSKSPLDKLQAQILLVEQAERTKNSAALRQGLGHTFDLAELLLDDYVQTHPDTTVEGSRAFAPLMQVVELGMNYSAEDTLDQIRIVPNSVLKAYCLAEAAQVKPRVQP